MGFNPSFNLDAPGDRRQIPAELVKALDRAYRRCRTV